VGGLRDRVDDVVGGHVRDDRLQFDLLVEIDHVLLAAPLALLDRLAAATADVRHREGGRTDLGEALLHVGQFARPDERDYHLDAAVVGFGFAHQLSPSLI
jgi:hypothetical protein